MPESRSTHFAPQTPRPRMLLADMTNSKAWRAFCLNISLILILVILGIFIGLFLNNKHLVETSLVIRARSHFDNILLARRWNAGYGGVYVEKKPGVESNPYLVNPDIHSAEGKTYTKKNPALMTREISELAQEGKDTSYQFHITSLKPLNPHNAPDEFERTALASFAKGEKEATTRQRDGERLLFRYMAPLAVEEPCLQCHAIQGYKMGDVRGGISVSFDMSDVQQALDFNRYVLIALYLATISVLLGIIYLFIKHLMLRLATIQAKIAEMAVTDELTGLYNRRYFFAKLQDELGRAKRHRHPISCLLFDIDFFKRVNDSYGHVAGDTVLKSIADRLKQNCRGSDLVARYGGEEFIQLLPETGREGAAMVAEKLRAMVAAQELEIDATTHLTVTISIGVASFAEEALDGLEDVDHIVQQADVALYQAKERGRNRVVFA